MIKLVLVLLLVSGCAMTPVQKLRFYDCHYFEESGGFCCLVMIPEKDRDILTCENGRELNEQQQNHIPPTESVDSITAGP